MKKRRKNQGRQNSFEEITLALLGCSSPRSLRLLTATGSRRCIPFTLSIFFVLRHAVCQTIVCHCSMDEDHTASLLLSDEELSCHSKLSRGAHNSVLSLFLRSYQWLRFLVTFDLSKVTIEKGEMQKEWRCRRESNPRMEVLQTPALPLGYGTIK